MWYHDEHFVGSQCYCIIHNSHNRYFGHLENRLIIFFLHGCIVIPFSLTPFQHGDYSHVKRCEKWVQHAGWLNKKLGTQSLISWNDFQASLACTSFPIPCGFIICFKRKYPHGVTFLMHPAKSKASRLVNAHGYFHFSSTSNQTLLLRGLPLWASTWL